MKSLICWLVVFLLVMLTRVPELNAAVDDDGNTIYDDVDDPDGDGDDDGGGDDTDVPEPDQPDEPTVDFCESSVKEWGFQCKDCKTMVTCAKLGGVWQSIVLGDCDNTLGFYCNKKEAGCTKTKDCSAESPVPFKCNMEGVYPDPYDCQKFHVCADESTDTLKTINMQCPNKDFAFSSKTNECSARKSTSQLCAKRQFTCLKAGDMAAWPENPNIFYVCIQSLIDGELTRYPTFFKCEYGESYNGVKCVKSNGYDDDVDESDNQFSSTSIAGATGNPPIAYQCKQQGPMKDPTNCRKYIICNNKLQKVPANCPPRTHYDDHVKSCVLGEKCSINS